MFHQEILSLDFMKTNLPNMWTNLWLRFVKFDSSTQQLPILLWLARDWLTEVKQALQITE